ncbi:hypothetical protein [Maribacter sp.]|uniref:hypothetical protein n=1 Tax=Maribacter sp. TaxID=1897614 RepID=UPI0025C1F85A|nr:hypothetical protein [Maribacter sp.]
MSLIEQHTVTTDFVILGKSFNSDNFLTMHNVRNGRIAEEVPFTKKTAMAVFGVFEDFAFTPKTFAGIIPKNIVHASDTATEGLQLVWTVKKGTRKLMYSPNTGIENGQYAIPTLVFKYNKYGLSVFAIADGDCNNINEFTPLHHAPFFNVYNHGGICMGNVKLKKVGKLSTFDACASFLENAFFNSIFTHSNNREIIDQRYISDNRTAIRWNTKNLTPIKRTLREII